MAFRPAAGTPAAPPSPLSPVAIVGLGLLPFGLGYFLSYLFRAANAVVASDLVAELQLDAASLGFLTAAYLLTFSLVQLPLGVLLDRYGPRRVQAVLLLIGTAGALLFAVGRDTLTLTIARALIGLGFAGGLMSCFKAVVLYVPEQRRALGSMAVMSLGALGLMVATAPLSALSAAFGWRAVFMGLAAMTAAVAAFVWLAVPRPDPVGAPTPLLAQVKALGGILSDSAFWRLAPVVGLSAGVHIGVQTLWAGPWLKDVAGFGRGAVAQHLFWMAFAFFIGVLGSGVVADVFTRRGRSTLDVLLGFLAIFFVAQAAIVAGIAPLAAWLVFGCVGQVAVLAYPWLASFYGIALSGRANAAMNLAVFATAFAVQWAFGAVIDLFPRTASGGYPERAYQVALGGCLALQIAALLWYLPARPRLIRAAPMPQ
jgi:predicted MFS family arabinose efflux permease